MATCRCGADISWYNTPTGKLAVDANPTMRGPSRYTVEDDDRLTAVDPDREVLAYQDHRETCPMAG